VRCFHPNSNGTVHKHIGYLRTLEVIDLLISATSIRVQFISISLRHHHDFTSTAINMIDRTTLEAVLGKLDHWVLLHRIIKCQFSPFEP
jgi:hypothetical protein